MMTVPHRTGSDAPTLLIVDDNSELRGLCQACLRLSGFRVLEAEDGFEALLVASQHEGCIDVLITDIQMPRIRGTDLSRILKMLRPKIRVLYISGSSDESIQPTPSSEEFFLPKPFSPKELVQTVEMITSVPCRHSAIS